MLIVERVKGTPNLLAALAAKDFTIGVLHAGEARRRQRHRHRTGWPTMSLLSERLSI